MKIKVIDTFALTAAALALVLVFVSPETGVSLAATLGILSVFNSDVGKTIEPIRVPAGIYPFDPPGQVFAEKFEAA